MALALATHLRQHWFAQSEYREGSAEARGCSCSADRANLPHIVHSALVICCAICHAKSDLAAAELVSREAVEVARALRDRVHEGRALSMLADIAWRRIRARGRHGDCSARRWQLLDGEAGEASSTCCAAGSNFVLSGLGDHAAAIARQRELVEISSDGRVPTPRSCPASTFSATLERFAGKTEHARRSFTESIELSRKSGNINFLASTLHSLGAALHESAPADALVAFSESLEARALRWTTENSVAYCLEGGALVIGRLDPTQAVVHSRCRLRHPCPSRRSPPSGGEGGHGLRGVALPRSANSDLVR